MITGKVLIIFPNGEALLVPRVTAKRVPLVPPPIGWDDAFRLDL